MNQNQLIEFLISAQAKHADFIATFIGGDKYRLESLDLYRDNELSVKFEDSLIEVPHDFIRSQAFNKIADKFNSQTIEIANGKRKWYSSEAELPSGFIWTSSYPSEAVGMVYTNEDILEIYDNSTDTVLYKI